MLGIFLLSAGITWLIILNDVSLLSQINTYRNTTLESIARWFSFWGDYPTGSLTIAAALWLAGYFSRKINWRRAAIACLIAATITGTISVTTRCMLGRPRPSAHIADGLYGPSLSYNYQAFPSGHSATAWGTATALIITAPPVGIPLACGAAAVVWSRMYLERHHPSDIFAGSWIGILGGLIAGLGCRYSSRKTVPVSQPTCVAHDAPPLDFPALEPSLLSSPKPYVPAPILVASSTEASKNPHDFA